MSRYDIDEIFDSGMSRKYGLENLGGTCYLNSCIQLLRKCRSVFDKRTKCTCNPCEAYSLMRNILYDKVGIEEFVKEMGTLLRGYYLKKWRPSHEFLSKVFTLTMNHEENLLGPMILRCGRWKEMKDENDFSTYNVIQDINRSDITKEFDFLQKEGGIRFGNFPDYLLLTMKSFKTSSIRERGIRVNNYHNGTRYFYDFLGAISESRTQSVNSVAFSKLPGKNDFFKLNDRNVYRVSFDYIKRYLLRETSVVDTILLGLEGTEKISDHIIREFNREFCGALTTIREKNKNNVKMRKEPEEMGISQDDVAKEGSYVNITKKKKKIQSRKVKRVYTKPIEYFPYFRSVTDSEMICAKIECSTKPFFIPRLRACPSCGWTNQYFQPSDNEYRNNNVTTPRAHMCQKCNCCKILFCFHCVRPCLKGGLMTRPSQMCREGRCKFIDLQKKRPHRNNKRKMRGEIVKKLKKINMEIEKKGKCEVEEEIADSEEEDDDDFTRTSQGIFDPLPPSLRILEKMKKKKKPKSSYSDKDDISGYFVTQQQQAKGKDWFSETTSKQNHRKIKDKKNQNSNNNNSEKKNYNYYDLKRRIEELEKENEDLKKKFQEKRKEMETERLICIENLETVKQNQEVLEQRAKQINDAEKEVQEKVFELEKREKKLESEITRYKKKRRKFSKKLRNFELLMSKIDDPGKKVFKELRKRGDADIQCYHLLCRLSAWFRNIDEGKKQELTKYMNKQNEKKNDQGGNSEEEEEVDASNDESKKVEEEGEQ